MSNELPRETPLSQSNTRSDFRSQGSQSNLRTFVLLATYAFIAVICNAPTAPNFINAVTAIVVTICIRDTLSRLSGPQITEILRVAAAAWSQSQNLSGSTMPTLTAQPNPPAPASKRPTAARQR